MTESEFEALADAELAAIERALEFAGTDAEAEAAAGGVLEIVFGDGSRIVVNRHSAAREIWVAARSGAFHFRHEGGQWRDTRAGEELFAALSRLVSVQSGRPIILRRPAPG